MEKEKRILFPAIPAFTVTAKELNGKIFPTLYESLLFIPTESGVFQIKNRLYTLEKGDALLLPPFTLCRPIPDTPSLHGFSFGFPPDVLRDFAPTLSLQMANGEAVSLPTEVKAHLLEVAKDLTEATSSAPHRIFSLFSILEHFALPKEKTALQISLPKLLRRILAYIEENPAVGLSAKTLSERFEVSESTVLRLFRAHLDTTPRGHIERVRTLRALALISCGHAVTDAAMRAGFCSGASFTAAYRRLYGIPLKAT